MRTIVHLSDLHFGRVDPALLEPLRRAVAASAARRRRRLGRPHPARARGAVRARRAPSSTACRGRRSSCPATTTCRCTTSARASCSPLGKLPALHHARPRADLRRRRDRGARHQHGALADVQGRAHQRGADGERSARALRAAAATTRAQGRRHPPSVRPARRARTSDDLVGRARDGDGGVRRLRRRPAAGRPPAHAARPASTAARYEIAGYAALVVQAGTATSTRGRGEANSFNVLRVRARRDRRRAACLERRRRARFALEGDRALPARRRALDRVPMTAGAQRVGFLVLQQPPHHLARARLGQRVDELRRCAAPCRPPCSRAPRR